MLTARQQKVADLVAKGLPDKAIARQIGVSVYTVRRHIAEAASRLCLPYRRRHALTLFVLNGGLHSES